MRQSNEAELIRSIEERGAARERVAQAKRQARISNQLIRVRAAILRLEHMLDTESDPSPEKPQSKKRKAVEASEQTIEDIRACYFGANGKALTTKNIRQLIPTLGPKYIAAACRVLAARGVLEAVGERSYRLTQRKENGLDGTAETRR